MYDVLTVSAALDEGYVKFKKDEDNRFVSCDVDTALKNRILEAVKNAKPNRN